MVSSGASPGWAPSRRRRLRSSGAIPGVGTLAGAGIGAAGGLLSGGGISGIAQGALGGASGGLLAGQLGGGGGSIGDLARIGLLGAGVFSGAQGARQAGRDSAEARRLTGEAVAGTAEEAERAQAEFALSAPLREAFRNASLNFFDPTNPFARNAAAGFGPDMFSPANPGVGDPRAVKEGLIASRAKGAKKGSKDE